VVATVITALLATGGAFAGSVIAANREDQRSSHEFWRAQRTAQYADFVAAIDEAQLLMEPYRPPSTSPMDLGSAVNSSLPLKDLDPVATDAELSAIQEAIGQVASATGKVSVVGGEVASIADALEQDLRSDEQFVEIVHNCQTPAVGNLPCNAQAGRRDDTFLTDRKKFLTATQKQLNESD